MSKYWLVFLMIMFDSALCVFYPEYALSSFSLTLILAFVVIFFSARSERTFIIEDSLDNVFEHAMKVLPLWKKAKISKIDKANHSIELSTKIGLYSFGEIISINFKTTAQNRVQIDIRSELVVGLVDYNINKNNLDKFEEIMGLQPKLATHLITA